MNGARARRFGAIDAEAAEIVGAGRVVATQADVSRESDVEQLFQTARACFGRIDIAINNAGTSASDLLVSRTLSEWDRVVATNLTGCLLVARELVRSARADRRSGVLVTIGSIAQEGAANNGSYSATNGRRSEERSRGRSGRCVRIVKLALALYADGGHSLDALESRLHENERAAADAHDGRRRRHFAIGRLARHAAIDIGIDLARVRETDVARCRYAFSRYERRLLRDAGGNISRTGLLGWVAKEAGWKAFCLSPSDGPDAVELQTFNQSILRPRNPRTTRPHASSSIAAGTAARFDRSGFRLPTRGRRGRPAVSRHSTLILEESCHP